MRFLIDEQMSPSVSLALGGLIAASGGGVTHVRDHVPRRLTDDEIPGLCQRENIQTLITMNVKDFGAKRHYYAALLAEGIHVVVVRPSKLQPNPGQQLALVAQHWSYIEDHLADAPSAKLIKATFSGATERSLEDLVNEIQGLP